MKAEQNELITRIGPGTPCGDLMRSYWQPVALVDEFDPRLDPRMAARAGEGGAPARPGPGAVQRRRTAAGACSTATARTAAPTSSFGRHEGDGLRCPFHGWKFDVDGRCLETPAEPAGSKLCDRVAPAQLPGAREERRPVRLARRRRLDAAALPRVRLLRRAGDATRFAFKGLWHCQLAAGVRGRHRSGASVVPAPLPAATRRWTRRRERRRASSSAAPAPATSAASAGR